VKSPIGLMLFAIVLTGGDALFGQGLHSGQIDGLADSDYFDAFCIGNVAHIFCNSSLPESGKAVTNLAKIIAVDRAAIHSAPDSSTRALIDLMFDFRTKFSEESVSAVNYGDSGYIWRVERSVSPAMGGSTGVPPKYLSYVNADGALIIPSKYLFGQKRVGPETKLYSVLSFADFENSSSTKSTIDGEEALRLAKADLDSLCKEAEELNFTLKTRFHDQKLISYPIKTLNTGKDETCNVWQVRFLVANNASFELFDSSPIIVWVTYSGKVSKLSLNSWNAEICRRKDCTEADDRPQPNGNPIPSAR
jgi:hypothetical protein